DMGQSTHMGQGKSQGEAAPLRVNSGQRKGAVLKAADIIDRGIALLCQGVLLLTGVALMGVLTANVIARYVLATGGFDWAEEGPEQGFPWFIMAGGRVGRRDGGHR